MEVKNLTTQWRSLNIDLRAHSDLLDKTRQELNLLEAEHATGLVQWEAQKQLLVAAVEEAGAHVLDAEQRAAATQSAADEKTKKYKERAVRNTAHANALKAERDAVAAKKSVVVEEDTMSKARLEEFRSTRDATREHLSQAIVKLQEAIESERQDIERRTAEMSTRCGAMRRQDATEVAEAIAHCQRRKEELSAKIHSSLEAQLAASTIMKSRWAALLRHNAPSSGIQEAEAQIEALRIRLRPRH